MITAYVNKLTKNAKIKFPQSGGIFMDDLFTHHFKLDDTSLRYLSSLDFSFRTTAIIIIKFIINYTIGIDNKELTESWKQIYLWASSLRGKLYEDCLKMRKLSSLEEARELLENIVPLTKGDPIVEEAVSALCESFFFWAL
jgi:hypothetical protein